MSRSNGVHRPQPSTRSKIMTLLMLISLVCAGTLQPRNVRAVASFIPDAPQHQPYRYLVPPVRSEASAPSAPLAQAVPVGVVARSQYTRTRLNDDGSYTTTFGQRPMHWQDPQTGAWNEFNNTLRPVRAQDAQGYAFENSANGFQARFGTPAGIVAGRPVLRFEAAGAALSLVTVGARPKNVQVRGAQITYVDAYADVDVRYTVDNERVKEDLVLRQAPVGTTPPVFAFDLDLEGVSATKQPDGAILLHDAQGQARFVLPRPFLIDTNLQAAPERGYSDAVAVTLTERGSSNKVRVTYTPSLAWLQDPARVYPVILDPSVVQLETGGAGSSGKNAMVNQASAATNYQGNTVLYIGKDSSGQRKDTLIEFPVLSGMPSDSVILSSFLELEAVGGTHGMATEVRANSSSWNPATVTWNTAPSSGSTIWATTTTSVGVTSPTTENRWDVTRLVREWVRGERSNYGLRVISTGSNGQSTSFYSSYYGDAACFECQPELDINFVPASRYGRNRVWTYTNQDHGGGNTSYVNLSTGNVVLEHRGGSIPARGFDVDLTHTYNSQDPYGQAAPSGPDTRGAFYGESWSLGQDLRLTEVDSGNGVILRDGTGGTNRVYVKDGDSNGTRSYLRPLHYDHTLTKDVKSTPTDASRVYTLTADEGAIKHFFDAEGKRTRVEDRNGNYLTFGYDTSDRMIRITDVAGRNTTLEYLGTGGRLSKITDMAGRVSTYGYDSAGNVTTIKHAVGTVDEVTTTFHYDDLNQLVRVTNPRGHTSRINYQYLARWETTGSVEGWGTDYGGPSGTTQVSQSTTQFHSGSGSLRLDLSNVTAGETSNIEWGPATPQALSSIPQELVAWVYVPTGATALQAWWRILYAGTEQERSSKTTLVTGRWNAVRFRDAVTNPRVQVRQIEIFFEPQAGAPAFTDTIYVDDVGFKGRVDSLTDAKPTPNTLVKYSYNWESKTTTVARPDQGGTFRNTSYVYSRAGQVTKVTDPLNNVSDTAYDSSLRLTTVTLPGGTSSSYSYSYYPNSNQIQTTKNELGETSRRGADTNNGDTRYTIDPLNEQRRTSSVDYEANVVGRDGAGNVTSVATNWYAAAANLEQSTPPPATSTVRSATFTYGMGGVIASMKDANGNTTNFTYDTGTGYLTKIDAPAGSGETTRRVTTITRNADGTTQQVVDPKGQTTTYEYDGLTRLRKINYGVGSSSPFSVSYTLDANGNMTAMSDKAGSSSWTYDENNQRTSESRTQNGVTKSAAYRYFANGLMSGMTTLSGQTVSYGYDNALHLTSETDPNDAGRTISYGYDGRGRRTSITYGSGVTQNLTYDKADRVDLLTLKTSGGTTLQSFDYYYGFSATDTRQADYANGFVKKVTEGDGSVITYSYDDLDRLTSATRTGTYPFTHSYAYDKNNNRTSVTASGTTTTATFDAANQMTALGGTSYSYDRNGNVTAFGSNSLTYDVSNQWTSGTINGQSVSFGYDGHGRRTNRSVAGSRTDFWYDETGLTLETGAASAIYLRDLDGNLLSVKSGTTFANYGRDRLGSTTGLVSTGGSLTNTYAYDPWGQSIGTTGSAYNAFQFTGVYRDSATSLYRMDQRFYQPSSGRFTQLDPLPKNLISINRYAYANCNPSNFVDPTGLDGVLTDCQVALAGWGIAFGLMLATAAAPVSWPVVALVLLEGGATLLSIENALDECT